jgi:hypothetical protein
VAQPFLLAPSGANIGLMFGAIGGAAASGSIVESNKAFAAYLESSSISIETIVREELERALRESGRLAIAGAADTAAPQISISVRQYGFGVTHLLGSNVVPVLDYKCDMVDDAGKLLWSAGERMGPSIASPMEAVPWDKLRDNPKQMEEEWRKAAAYLAKQIVAKL